MLTRLTRLTSRLGGFRADLGIDLGTANTLVHVRDRGVVIAEPSVVATETATGRLVAVGTEAQRMLGRTPATIAAIRPLRAGVIVDFDLVARMVRHFIHAVHAMQDWLPLPPRPRVLLGVPSGVTEVERRAVQEVALRASAREAYLIEEPVAAALGAGMPIHDPSGSMVVDIGGGTTDVAVISLGGIVTSCSIRIGGDAIDEQIVQFARRVHGLAIGERTAEAAKLAVGAAVPLEPERTVTLRGRDLVTGLFKAVEVSSRDVQEVIDPPVGLIVAAVKQTLEATPPELLADIMERGMVLVGGGALLAGLDHRLQHETGIAVRVAPDPMACVVRGTGLCLERLDAYRPILAHAS